MLRRMANVKFSKSEDTLTALVFGEIDHHGAREIRESIDREAEKLRPSTLTLDLSGVNFMDSSGLGLILGRYNHTKKLGIGFSVIDPSPSAERILSAAGAERIITIQRNET